MNIERFLNHIYYSYTSVERFFPPPIYNRYYKEFVSGEEDFVTWHIIAYLLLIGAALIFTASVILIDKWN